MTTQIFKTRARVSPSIAERLLGRPPKANAIVDLRDSLANSADLREVTPQQVEAIALQYRTNLHRELRDERGSLYREYLEWSLKDGVLDDAEFEKLGHLRRVLFLDPDQVDLIHEDTLGSLYKSSVRKRAESADAASTSSFAAELAARLKLTEKLSERWRKDVLTSVISSRVDQMAADERISPEEDSELTMLAQSYGIKLGASDFPVARFTGCA